MFFSLSFLSLSLLFGLTFAPIAMHYAYAPCSSCQRSRLTNTITPARNGAWQRYDCFTWYTYQQVTYTFVYILYSNAIGNPIMIQRKTWWIKYRFSHTHEGVTKFPAGNSLHFLIITPLIPKNMLTEFKILYSGMIQSKTIDRQLSTRKTDPLLKLLLKNYYIFSFVKLNKCYFSS